MRSLNTSLPRSPRKHPSTQPPEQLVQAFKTAALSVTNLYKTAAADDSQARQAGYQDALDDILAFLDRENLGLDDGEGWRVRQWATERLDGSPTAPGGSDSDDERVDAPRRPASNSPPRQRTMEQEEQRRQPSRSTTPTRATSLPVAPQQASSLENLSIAEPPRTFTFRSTHPYPQDMDLQTPDIASNRPAQPSPIIEAQTTPATPAVRVEIVPRGSRTPHRGSTHTTRHGTRSATSARSGGPGAGTKRKITFGDYFDLGSLGELRDGGAAGSNGGGKRSRLV